MAILTELRDPRIENVTVTYVEVSADMRQAKVHVSIMGDDSQQKLCLHGLRSSAGFLQQKVARRIDTRYTPRLSFELDDGVKKSIEVARILSEVLPQEDVPDEQEAVHPTEASADGEGPSAAVAAPEPDNANTDRAEAQAPDGAAADAAGRPGTPGATE